MKLQEREREKVFASVVINEQSKNKGLAKSIIEGVTSVVNQYGSVIVLEDDIMVGVHFLEYMNSALRRYKDDGRVWCVTGWASPISCGKAGGSFFYPVPDCWSWGTWADRWQHFKKDANALVKTFTKKMIWQFNCEGTAPDMWQQVLANAKGVLDTWAIFWYATVFQHGGLCLAPTRSLVKNIGFDGTGEHCGTTHAYDAIGDINHAVTEFPRDVAISKDEWRATKKFNYEAFVAPVQRAKKRKLFKKLRKVITFPFRAVRKVYRLLRDAFFPDMVCGTVFMLHRVGKWDDNALYWNEHMKIEPHTLQAIIDKMRETHNIIPSTQVHDYISKKRYKEKPFCVFTMDDGYKDNFTEAYPVFKKNNVPFTIFLAATFAQKEAVMWWYVLEDLLQENDEITLADGSVYQAKTKTEKEQSFLAIREKILALDQENLVAELDKMFVHYKVDWIAKCDNLCLDWDDVAKLDADPLCTIGAHTYHHYNLKALATRDGVIKEIDDGLEILKAHGILPTVFAYPFGSPGEVGEREIEVLQKMDFSNAFVAYGDETKRRSYNRFAVGRLMLTEKYAKEFLK